MRVQAFAGGKSFVQKLFERLNLWASLATGTGKTQDTAAIPQSEASVALRVPRVLALRLTTARVAMVSMQKSSSRRPPESRTT
jgi:hypothetical protein